jgi:hypothetical protein
VAALNADEEMPQLPIEFELIIAQYVNPYPCIGACYLDPASPDLESTIIEKISELLLRSDMLVLTRYLAENKESIHHFNETLRIRNEEYFAGRAGTNS